MRKYSARSLRNLKGIHPDLRRVMDRALQETTHDFMVTSGLRTIEEQRRMVESGASQTMNSAHLTGYAVDIAYFVNGQIVWDWPVYDQNAQIIKKIADQEGVPLQWGGDWTTLRDGPHFELRRDHYDWKAPFNAVPVERVKQATAKAGENKGSLAATATTAAGTIGTLTGQTQNAPEPLQYAIAAAIVIAVGVLAWKAVK